MFKLTRSTDTQPARRVCVLGIGGGGCAAINKVDAGVGGPAIAALDTDAATLAATQAVTKLQIGGESDDNIGTGGDHDLGKLAAERNIEMIRGLFTDADIAVVVTGLGGGTGSGAAPVVLKTARSSGAFTIVLATLPFEFEGEKRKRRANDALSNIVEEADLVCVVYNDRLMEAVKENQIEKAFDKADEMLVAGVGSIWQMLVLPGFIGIDLADLRSLTSGGTAACRFGFGIASGAGRAQSAVDSLLTGSVLDEGKALGECAQALICVAGSHDLTVTEVGDIMSAVSGRASEDCDLVMGTVINGKWRDRVMVSAFVADRKRSVSSTPRSSSTTSARGSRKRKQDLQDKLKLDVSGKGRFKNVEATILDGQDLDIPTFVRRGIKIEK